MEPLRNTSAELLRDRARAVKLIVCDLDGTLLNSEKLVSERTISAIRAAEAMGVRTTICSGRIFPMLEAYIRTLDLSCPLISSNGAVVSDPNGRILRHTRINPDDCYSLLAYSLKNRLDISLLSDEACYFSANSVRVNRFHQYNDIAALQGMRQIRVNFLPDSAEPLEEKVLRDLYPELADLQLRKILIYELEPGQLEAARIVIGGLSGLSITTSDEGLFDVVPAGVSKGYGLRQLCAEMGLSPEEIMVFGDFDNDESMFEWAGISIAMGNAVPALKAMASAVTDSNDDDGVARAIETYILRR